MRQVFLDTETTGLDPAAGDRIVEIGCIEMVNRRTTGRTLHLYLNPERAGGEEAIRIQGHARIPESGLVAEVDARFEHLAHCDGHEIDSSQRVRTSARRGLAACTASPSKREADPLR